jgi:hypothetical protein
MKSKIPQNCNCSETGAFIAGAIIGAAGVTYAGLKIAQYISRTPTLSKMIQSIGGSPYDNKTHNTSKRR